MSDEVVHTPRGDWPAFCPENGLSAREITAIELRIPQSGRDWIDEMIRNANRNELAAKAMQAMLSTYRDTSRSTSQEPDAVDYHTFGRDMALDKNGCTGDLEGAQEIASDSYLFADAMLAAREVKQ